MNVYNFFIDKIDKDSTEIIVRPDFPIICSEKERLTLKLVDFQYLNTAYNISEALYNNKFKVNLYVPQSYYTTYTHVPETNYYTTTHFINKDPFFNNVTITHLPGNFEKWRDNITGYSIYAQNPNMITGYDEFGNPNYATLITRQVFQFYPSDFNWFMDFLPNFHYFIIEKEIVSPVVNYFVLQQINLTFFFINYENPIAGTTTMTFKVSASNTFEGPYTELTTTDNVITIAQNYPVGETFIKIRNQGTNTPNTVSWKFYKLEMINRTPTTFPANKLFLKNVFYLRAIPAENVIPATSTDYPITIEDGFYNTTDLITKINAYSTSANAKISLQLRDFTNKIYISNTEAPVAGTIKVLIFPNKTTANMYGFNNTILSLNTAILSDTYINIMNFSKIILSTDLTFSVKTHNELTINSNNRTKGIGNVITWISSDEPPMTCIKYKNNEGTTYKLDNKYVSAFKLSFYNEKSLPLNLDNALIHLQIIKNKK
jgi:hypothetical protein